MPIYEQFFAIRSLAIDQTAFVDVTGTAVLPIDCNVIVIFNNSAQDIFLRTDPNNAASQVTINPGQQFEVGTQFGTGARGARFPKGCQPPCSLKASASGVNPIIESIF